MNIQPLLDKAKAIDGWMSFSELSWLAQTAADKSLIIEVGCYKGRSTRAIADNCNGAKVYAVDPYHGNYLYDDGRVFKSMDDKIMNQFYHNLKDHLTSGKVTHHRETLDSFVKNLEEKPDFIFLDGDHRYDEVMNDIRNSLKVLSNGGILSGHDYTHKDWPGVKKAVSEIFGKVNLVDSIWWTVL